MEFIYKALRGTLEHTSVTEDEVDRQLTRLQQQTPRMTQVTDRAAKSGDEVILDYAGYCGGVQFEGGTAEKQALTLGSGMFIPGFEEQLVGAKIGEDVVVHVTFPKDYRAENLAGKEAEFRCKIHEIHEKSAYALDDAFAREVGQCPTLAALRSRLKESLQAYYDECAEMELQDQLMRQAAATLDYTPAKDELEKAMDAQLEVLRAQLAQRGLTLEAYCQFTGAKEDQLREDTRAEDESALRIQHAAERSRRGGRGGARRHLPAERHDDRAAPAVYERGIRADRRRQHPHEEGHRLRSQPRGRDQKRRHGNHKIKGTLPACITGCRRAIAVSTKQGW